MKSVFVSGSISIKTLPSEVIKSFDKNDIIIIKKLCRTKKVNPPA